MSDHLPAFINIESTKKYLNIVNKETINIRHYNKFNADSFLKDLNIVLTGKKYWRIKRYNEFTQNYFLFAIPTPLSKRLKIRGLDSYIGYLG